MKKQLLILFSLFTLLSLGNNTGTISPVYSYENNLSNINCYSCNSIYSASITPITGVATNSLIALANNNIVNAFSYPTGTITPITGVATNSYIALMGNNIVNAISSYTTAPTFSNLSVSTLSVGSTSTLTGIVTTSSLTSGGSLYLNAATGNDVFLQSNGTTRFRVNTSYGAIGVPYRVGSTTAPSSTLDVTGTMSVSSNATVAGNFYAPSIASSAGLDVGCGGGSSITFYRGASAMAGILSYGYFNQNLRVGATSTPSATLDVTGTMSVSSWAAIAGSLNLGSNTNQLGNCRLLSSNNATWTTGNTGTVAVLSDAVFPIQLSQSFHSPADGTTYYFGGFTDVASSNALTNIVYVPYNCTLVGWTFNGRVQTTPSSAETSTLNIRIDNTTDVLLSSSITFSLASGFNNYNATGLSQNINAGSYINAKLVSPSWATNPTNVGYGLTLWFVRRQ